MAMLERLESALLHGMTLALAVACGGTAHKGPDAETGGNGTSTGGAATGGAATGGTAGGGGSGADFGGEVGSLPALPNHTYPYCTGTDFGQGGGYYGQCCAEVLCMPASKVDGVAKCPIADSEPVRQMPGYPPGSGSCECAPPEGPFEATPGRAPSSPAGPCCYVVSGISCEGRPLRDQGELLLARVVRRTGWGARAARFA